MEGSLKKGLTVLLPIAIGAIHGREPQERRPTGV